jgi:tRNA(fMet)-specific endonuclease VapC
MNFLLDTCTLSAHVRRPAGLQARFIQYSGRLYVPSVALAELYVLAYRLDDPTPRLDAIEQVIHNEVVVVDFDTPCARVFGRLRAELIQDGVGVSPIDLLIACVALTYGMTLVTHNTAHFQFFPGLQIVDWLVP